MMPKILEIIDQKKFNSPEVLRLVIFRVLKTVLFCLSLTFLFWFALQGDYLFFALLLGLFLGVAIEITVNSRKKCSRQ